MYPSTRPCAAAARGAVSRSLCTAPALRWASHSRPMSRWTCPDKRFPPSVSSASHFRQVWAEPADEPAACPPDRVHRSWGGTPLSTRTHGGIEFPLPNLFRAAGVSRAHVQNERPKPIPSCGAGGNSDDYGDASMHHGEIRSAFPSSESRWVTTS
jgi:hypothetical protein